MILIVSLLTCDITKWLSTVYLWLCAVGLTYTSRTVNSNLLLHCMWFIEVC